MLGQSELSVRLFAVTGRIRDEIGGKMGLADLKEYETCLRQAKSQIDERTYGALWNDGQKLSTELAIEDALSRIEIHK